MTAQEKREKLKQIGFKEIPHFTVMQNLIFDLGRNRELSFGNIGTPNETLYLCELNEGVDIISDLICLRNYDYDGYNLFL